jgi:ribosomal protein S12 methylthiotransferase accessory factor
MGRVGACADNAGMESFFSLLQKNAGEGRPHAPLRLRRRGRSVRLPAHRPAGPYRGGDGRASSPRRSADLRDDLVDLLWRYLDNGLDVVVVDQTTPEHRGVGLACVKVIVPGMLPMTFGHHARRVVGLPRLYGVPYRLGYRSAPLTTADVNPHAHPFP